jgi:hypothetical protein
MTLILNQESSSRVRGQRKHHPDAPSAGKTISTIINTTVTAGVGGYASPLSITSTGGIEPAAYSAAGLMTAVAGTVDTITNAGVITGGGGAYGSTGGVGGDAAVLSTAFIVTNKGIIAAGSGGYAEYTGGQGGTGVAITASGTFTNSGQINAGNGGYGYEMGGAAGYGVGLHTSATLNNSGIIRGGYGGHAGLNGSYGVRGGYGVFAGREDLVKNTGVILGGDGSSAYMYGGGGGIGILVEYGSLNNRGTVAGGSGGAGGTGVNGEGATGGAGVELLNASSASNAGVILGGNGDYGYFRGGYGGTGVYLQTYGTMANSGTITGGAGGNAKELAGNGGTGLDILAYSTASNSGVVNGGNGGAAVGYYGHGGAGGGGVLVSRSSFTNDGTINGGVAGATPGFKNRLNFNINYAGGYGLEASDGVVTNAGLITGGRGGDVLANGGTAGDGGVGVSLNGSTFTNTGTIIGGTGGSMPQSYYNNAYGGYGGAGAVIGAGAALVNHALIQGGAGGYNIYTGNTGGDGVIIDGGVFTNTGTVAAGYGGASQGHGSNGDAVFFAGAGTLVAATGAQFVGNVVSTLASGSEIKLTGTSSIAFSGIGSQFVGIDLISFANGAARTLEGKLGGNPQAAYQGALIGGFAAHDTLVLDGFAAIPSYTYIQTRYSRIDFTDNSGQYDDVNTTDLQAKDLEVTQGGGKTTLTGVGTTATTLGSGTAEFVRSTGVASGKIDKGAIETILTGGTVKATTIAGGDLYLAVGAKTSGTLSFSGTGGILDIASATMPTGTIAGFVSGDTIKLDGVAFNPNDTVTVGTAGTVTIVAPGISYDLNIAGAAKGETDFKFSAGSVLTTTAASKPAMNFIAPANATAAPPPAWCTAHDVTAFAVSAVQQLSLARRTEFATLTPAGPGVIHGLGWVGPQISITVGGLDMSLPGHARLSY